jgi:hypothetical protein
MNEDHKLIAEDLYSKVSMAMTQIGKTTPIYIMVLPGNEVYPIVIQDKDIDLQQYATLAMNIAQEYRAIAMILICEQYMVSKHKDDPEVQAILDGLMRASEHPDREEYLSLIYMDQSGKCESYIGKIHRDPMGTPFTRDSQWIEDAATSMITPWM